MKTVASESDKFFFIRELKDNIHNFSYVKYNFIKISFAFNENHFYR